MSSRRDVVESLRPRLGTALLAFDFDGTLAPIVSDPSHARLVAGAGAALERLARRGAQIALISGRDALTLVELSRLADLPGLIVEGIYGAEQWRAGVLRTLDDPPVIDRLRRELPHLLATTPWCDGVWIEDKRLSLVLHTRQARKPGYAQEELWGRAPAYAAQLGLEAHPGNHVIEFRLPGYDKAGALRRLVHIHRPTAVLYAGDDLGDVPAVTEVSRIRRSGVAAHSVAVGAPPPEELAAAADLVVADPGELSALLTELLG
ncbi:MAG: trehalose-phosphatase [Actinomycetota bacterium]|nr:trehalose-phosphatase [Actinomycetota bacterium]